MNTKERREDTKIKAKNSMQIELDKFPDIGCEKEDIVCAMKDEAEFSRNWINDSLLRRYIKKSGDDRLDAKTRKLIKLKSYETYISYSKELRRDLCKQTKILLSNIKES